MIYQVNWHRAKWLVSGKGQEVATFFRQIDAVKCARDLNALIFENNDYSQQAILRGDKEHQRLMIKSLNDSIKLLTLAEEL